jgi:hypothetical protein
MMKTFAKASLLILGLGLPACLGPQGSSASQEEDELGQVALALRATGPDGAVYS